MKSFNKHNKQFIFDVFKFYREKRTTGWARDATFVFFNRKKAM